jgi:hypothetical protein
VKRVLRWPGAAVFVVAAGLAYAGWYAAAAGFSVEHRIQCAPPVTQDGNIRAVFGRFDSFDSAESVHRLAVERGYRAARIQVDRCGRVAVILEGIPSRKVAEDLRREAATAGFRVTFEQG